MIKKKIRINLISKRSASNDSFFAEEIGDELDFLDEEEEPCDDATIEMNSEGILIVDDKRVVIAYDESELTGMEGSTTEVGFDLDTPGLVTMMRHGSVSTVLVFEEGKRHICTYQTEYMPFEDAHLEFDWQCEGVTRIVVAADNVEKITIKIEKI